MLPAGSCFSLWSCWPFPTGVASAWCERHPSPNNGLVQSWEWSLWKVVSADSCGGWESCGLCCVRMLYLTKRKRGQGLLHCPLRLWQWRAKQLEAKGREAITIQMSSCKDLKWLCPGKELGYFTSEASQGLADGVLEILWYGFFKKQIYPAWFRGVLFIPRTIGIPPGPAK